MFPLSSKLNKLAPKRQKGQQNLSFTVLFSLQKAELVHELTQLPVGFTLIAPRWQRVFGNFYSE
jgi:hypothetical protein